MLFASVAIVITTLAMAAVPTSPASAETSAYLENRVSVDNTVSSMGLTFRAMSKSSSAAWEAKPGAPIAAGAMATAAYVSSGATNASATVSYWLDRQEGQERIGVVFDTWNIAGQISTGVCKFIDAKGNKVGTSTSTVATYQGLHCSAGKPTSWDRHVSWVFAVTEGNINIVNKTGEYMFARAESGPAKWLTPLPIEIRPGATMRNELAGTGMFDSQKTISYWVGSRSGEAPTMVLDFDQFVNSAACKFVDNAQQVIHDSAYTCEITRLGEKNLYKVVVSPKYPILVLQSRLL